MRTKIKNPGPRARLFARHSIVVATGVVDPPPQTRTRQPTLVHPLAHRQPIECRYFGVVRTRRHRKRECSASFTITPRNPVVHFAIKLLVLLFVVFALSRVEIEAFVPA